YRGMADGAANVDEAVGIMVKARPLLKPDVTKQQWLNFIAHFCSDGMVGKPLGWHSPEDWSRGLKVLQEYAALKGSIDADRFYTNAFFTDNRLVSKTTCGKGAYASGKKG
ncbi:MAG TPA: hypothetical protein VNZ59_12310, partial [Burkholderiales bacterium]|nr:hypothetical protein [Burkholderiales bacterium]